MYFFTSFMNFLVQQWTRQSDISTLLTLGEKCPYLDFLWSVLVQLRENKDQKNYEYGNFSRSVSLCVWTKKLLRMILERITKKHVDKVLNFALFRNKDKNRLSVSSMICEFMLWISSFKLNIQVTLKDLRLKT